VSLALLEQSIVGGGYCSGVDEAYIGSTLRSVVVCIRCALVQGFKRL